MAFSVFKLLLKNMFSFGDFFENFKKGPKGILKNLLIIFLALYCIVVFVGIFGTSLLSIYAALEESGKTYILPCYGLILAILINLVFGFFSVSTNYYTGDGESQLLCMPLKPKDIFMGKFFTSLVTETIISSFLIILCAIIYGVKEHVYTNPLFYIGIITSLFVISVFCVFILYAVFVLLLTLCPFLRRKSFLQAIAAIIVIAFSCGIGMLSSYSSTSIASAESLENAQVSSVILNSWIGKASELPGISLFANCIIGDIKSILVMLALGAFIVFVLVPLISPFYIKSLNGFSDVKTKKMNKEQVQKVLNESYKTKSVLKSLYFRDIKIVLREPAFFVNGPLMVFIMPILFIIPFFLGLSESTGEGLSSFGIDLQEYFARLINNPDTTMLNKISYLITLVVAGFATFIGNASSIAATSFSREGKGLGNLKSMPISADSIILAKFLHALTYCVLSNVILFIIAQVGLFILGLTSFVSYFAIRLLLSTILSLVISLLLIFVEMFLDTINPKLNWENPTEAFKQNVNSIIAIFTTMAIVAIFVGLGFVLPKNMTGYVILLVCFVILAAPTGYFYFKYAPKKFKLMQ